MCLPFQITSIVILLAASFTLADPTQPWTTGSYYPPWANQTPTNTITLQYDSTKSSEENGSALADLVATLQPGDKLEVGEGTYSVNRFWNINLQGTVDNPIWIVAAEGENPVLTRPNANQNLINFASGQGDSTYYLCFRGFQLTGGSQLMRIYRCSHLWIDANTLHDGSDGGLTANSNHSEYLYITRNHIYNPGDGQATAECMYLGGNNASVIMRYSTIALNHVHHCAGTQGDGIEIKQGSYNNWVVGNRVHDTNYPGILLYGTEGLGINVVENNLVYNSNDNAMQIQGEAVVQNNLVISGGTAFSSTDHQGQTRNLKVIHNTFINSGRAVNLSSWNNRDSMVFANNAVYSQDQESIRFPNGSQGVSFSGNVTLGSVEGVAAGFTVGNGIEDFIDVAWDASQTDARPSPGSPLIESGDETYNLSFDMFGNPRATPPDVGAIVFGAPTSIFNRGPSPSGQVLLYRSTTSVPMVDVKGRLIQEDGGHPLQILFQSRPSTEK